MINLKIKLKGEKLKRQLKAMISAKDLAYKLAAEAALMVVRDEFRSSSDPYDQPWAPIQRDGQILVDTGVMRNSFTARAVSNGIVIGTNVPYAKYHQNGAQGRKHKIRTQRWSHKAGKKLAGKFAHRTAPKHLIYADSFMGGGGRIKARPMLPSGALPERWESKITRAIKRAYAKAMRAV